MLYEIEETEFSNGPDLVCGTAVYEITTEIDDGETCITNVEFLRLSIGGLAIDREQVVKIAGEHAVVAGETEAMEKFQTEIDAGER